MFLQELKDIRAECLGPWVLAGDFNLIYRTSDKNNSNTNRAMMDRFRMVIDDQLLKKPHFMDAGLHGQISRMTLS